MKKIYCVKSCDIPFNCGSEIRNFQAGDVLEYDFNYFDPKRHENVYVVNNERRAYHINPGLFTMYFDTVNPEEIKIKSAMNTIAEHMKKYGGEDSCMVISGWGGWNLYDKFEDIRHPSKPSEGFAYGQLGANELPFIKKEV